MCTNEHLRTRIEWTDTLKRRSAKHLYAGDLCCEICGAEERTVYSKDIVKHTGECSLAGAEMVYCSKCLQGGVIRSWAMGWTPPHTTMCLAAAATDITYTMYYAGGTDWNIA